MALDLADIGPREKSGYLAAWDATTGRLLGTAVLPGATFGFVFTPDGREILLATDEPREWLAYSTSTWKITRRIPIDAAVGGSHLTPIGYLDDGRTLLVAGGLNGQSDGWLHRLDATSLAIQDSAPVHGAGLKAVAISPDGTRWRPARPTGTSACGMRRHCRCFTSSASPAKRRGSRSWMSTTLRSIRRPATSSS